MSHPKGQKGNCPPVLALTLGHTLLRLWRQGFLPQEREGGLSTCHSGLGILAAGQGPWCPAAL